MYLLGGFEGMLIRGECWQMAQFGVYFDTIFSSENYRNLHLLHKNNTIVAMPLLGSPGKEWVVQFGVYLIEVCLK